MEQDRGRLYIFLNDQGRVKIVIPTSAVSFMAFTLAVTSCT